MFYHMSHPGAFIHTFKKTATGTYTAAVFNHGREHGFQPFPETINFIGRALFHFLQVQFHLDQFGAAYTPVIWASQHFNFNNLHK